MKPCPDCGGSGWYQVFEYDKDENLETEEIDYEGPCETCKGSGEVKEPS